MKPPSLENVRWYGIVVGLAAVLLLLAALQYRSGKAVSEATTAQMLASLQGSLMDVRLGLERELTPLCRELQSGSGSPGKTDLQEYAARFERWRRAAAHPNLVDAVFLWQRTDSGHSQFFKLNASRTAFEPASWPEDLSKIKDRLVEFGPGPGSSGEEGHGTFPGTGPSSAGESSFPDHGSPDSPDHHQPPPDNGREFDPGMADHSHSSDPSAIFRDRRPQPSGDSIPPPPRARGELGWMVDQNVPAVLHPFFESGRTNTRQQGPPAMDWIIVVLDRRVLGQHILPELVERYFGRTGQAAYDVAVTDSDPEKPDLYSSRPYSSHLGFDHQKDFRADAALNLFGRPMPIVAGRASLLDGLYVPPAQIRTSLPENKTASVSSTGFHDEGRIEIEPVHFSAQEQGWEILAKHREGSVEAAVAALSRQNLIFNFAVLLVLAATMGVIIAATLRGRRFARLQMDFVANVSHELRTPLTGIISAGQNIADGLVDDKQRVAQYGKAIVGEARQLSELVEQILLFSATQQDGHRYYIQSVDVAEVIEFSLQTTAGLIRSAEVTVKQHIQPDLPKVSADFKALAHCLQNLITNAVKYGGDGHWIGIQAAAATATKGGKEVTISVADKGIGIGRDELSHVFEPFYRTAEVTAAQIHGSGLGLPLAMKITEAMGGRLTVESVPGEGSTFTVHLPPA